MILLSTQLGRAKAVLETELIETRTGSRGNSHNNKAFRGVMARSIPSPRTPPGICWAFFTSPSPRGALPKVGLVGGALSENNSVFRTFKVAYGSTPPCANICTIVSTCEREMTERRTSTVPGKVAVLSVKNDLSYSRSYKNTFICERLLLSCSAGWSFVLFQKPHRGAFVRVS